MRSLLYGLMVVLTQVPLAGTAAEIHVVGAASSGGTTIIRATASGAARVKIHGVAEQGGQTILSGESHSRPRMESPVRPRVESPGSGCCCGGKAAPRSQSRSCHGVTRVTTTAKVYQGGCNTGYQRVYATSRSCRGGDYGANGYGIAYGASHAEVVGPRCGGATAFAIAESQVVPY
ncbi:MAG: hypothetical protein ACKO38_14395 [Planctomycetota bacterium]